MNYKILEGFFLKITTCKLRLWKYGQCSAIPEQVSEFTIIPRLEHTRTIKLARFSLIVLNEGTRYSRVRSISVYLQKRCTLHLISLLHGTKKFQCSNVISLHIHMQGTNHLLHDSHPDQEGTKGPLTGKVFITLEELRLMDCKWWRIRPCWPSYKKG